MSPQWVASSEKGNFGNHAGEISIFSSMIIQLEKTDKGNQKVIQGDLITFLKGNFSSHTFPAYSKTYGRW